MTTAASIGIGVYLKKGDGGSPTETFTDFGLELTSINPPGMTRESQDATNHSSADNAREFIPGLLAASDIAIEFNWVPTTAGDAVLTQLLAGVCNWQIGNAAWPQVYTVRGFFTNYQPQSPLDGKMTGTATLKVTGKPTVAAAS